jgi:acylphosphatase
MICKHVYYSGRVQGVGFRYTAQHVAAGFAVVGFVRNLPGGSVEMVAQGEADQVEAFLKAVAARLAGYIHDAKVHDESAADYRGFQVRY